MFVNDKGLFIYLNWALVRFLVVHVDFQLIKQNHFIFFNKMISTGYKKKWDFFEGHITCINLVSRKDRCDRNKFLRSNIFSCIGCGFISGIRFYVVISQ